MSARDRAPWALAVILSIALLISPALWNGFPLLQYDTGGYLARWYEGTLVPSRAVFYGLMLNAGEVIAFWPVVVVQAALTVWIVALTLRAHGLGKRPWLMLSVIAALTAISTLPWLTSILLTDIFAGLGVLALYLLLLRPGHFNRGERFALIALIAVCAATHSATIAVLLALILAGVMVWLVWPRQMPLARIGNGVLAITLGCVLVFAADFVVAKRLAWTPGGFALSFGRMLQDGIVNKYLDDHCPNPKLTLCGYKNQLPNDADVWFWGSPLFDKLGRFAGLDQEMADIAVGSVVDYPGLQIQNCRGRHRPATRCGAYRRRRAQFDLAHLRNDPAFHAPTRGAHGGGAPAAWRDVIHSDQPIGLSGCAAINGAASRDRAARVPAENPVRLRRIRRRVCARASRQRIRLRRNVESARPLWRAVGLDRSLCRHDRACTPLRSSPIILDRGSDIA